MGWVMLLFFFSSPGSSPSPILLVSLSEMHLRRLLLMFYSLSLWKETGTWEKGRKMSTRGLGLLNFFSLNFFNSDSYGSSKMTLFRH